MKNIKEILNNRKFVIVIILLLIVITLVTGTYAWLSWANADEEDTSLTLTIGKLADVTFTSGNDINTGLTPVFNYSDGESTTFAINNRDTSGTTVNYVVKLNVTSLPVISDENESIEALKSLKYVLLKGEEVVAENSLSGVSNGDSIEIYTGSMSTSGTESFTFYIYIDGNMENPSSMMNTTFVGELMVEAEEGELFVDFLTNKYLNANPTQTTVANNGIYYYYAPSVNMMNDGMNASHEWEDGANTGNIRYYGATPNNYIDIGDVYNTDYSINNWEKNGYPDSDSCKLDWDCDVYYDDWEYDSPETCYNGGDPDGDGINGYTLEEVCGTSIIAAGTPKLYRIIGLFKGVELSNGQKKDLVKVISNDSIGQYSWDQSAENVNNGNGINDWNQADLMKLLNPGFDPEPIGGSLYWNNGLGSCYGFDVDNFEYTTIPCDFSSLGLSASVKNIISTVKWNLGGSDFYDFYANEMYELERGENVVVPGTSCSGDECNDTVIRNTVWEGNVTLPYASDYGYAVDFNDCDNYTLYRYANCVESNWMYSLLISDVRASTWFLTPNSSLATGVLVVFGAGNVKNDGVGFGGNVLPVFYLDSSLALLDGDGSINEPFIVR